MFRVMGVILAILIVIWIVVNPVLAGNLVHGWINGIVTFFHHLS